MMLVTTFLPVVANNLPFIIGSFHFYAVIFLSSIIVFESNVLRHKNLVLTLIIGVFITIIFPTTIWWSIDDWNVISLRTEFYEFFVALVIFYYLQLNNYYEDYAKFIQVSLIFIGITMLMTLYAASINPMYARMMTGSWFNDSEESYFFSRLGGGTYGTAIAIMTLIPFGVFYLQHNKLLKYNKLSIIIYIILIFTALIKMQFFGNILVGFMALFLSFQSRNIQVRSIFFGLIFLIIIFIPIEFYASIISKISLYFDTSSEIYFKLNDFSKYLLTGEESTAAGERASRFPELLSAFLSSPLFGTFFRGGNNYIGEGAHLYWMNRITIMGLFGFYIFIQIFYKNIKFVLRTYKDKEFKFIYLLSIATFFSYGLIKNIAGREAYFLLFFILPGLQYLPLLKGKRILSYKMPVFIK